MSFLRIGAERHRVLQSLDGSFDANASGSDEVRLVYGFPPGSEAATFARTLGGRSLGPVPLLVRPLRVAGLPLVIPFGRRRTAVREIAVQEPRLTRLWERFCIDVGVAVERNAAFFTRRIFDHPERGYRVLIIEDGDRYAIRGACIFTIKDGERGPIGYVMDLLHDRSVDGMRAASHLLGLAMREASAAGAVAMRAWSLTQSGSFPIYAMHAFVPVPERMRAAGSPHFCVRVLDPDLHDIVTQRERWYLSYLDDETM